MTPKRTSTEAPRWMTMIRRLLGWCLFAGAVQISHAALVPDLVIINATVHTMETQRPLAEAVAISGNRIAAVGTSAEIKALAGSRTRIIDAHGQLVLPGFNDAHVHFLSGGFQLSSVDLRDAATPQELAERIRKFAATLPPGRWMTGGRWDHERWPTDLLPTR